MMAKPMKTLQLHYPMIQFLINMDIELLSRHLAPENMSLTKENFQKH